MDDLTAFITARLDEDEAAAKAADPGPWKSTAPSLYIDSPGIGIIVQTRHFETAEHIARHDPARVLREVTAKRAMVEKYARGRRLWNPETEHWFSPAAEMFGSDMEWLIRTLAAVWSDHPDYKQGWAL